MAAAKKEEKKAIQTALEVEQTLSNLFRDFRYLWCTSTHLPTHYNDYLSPCK